MPTVPSFTPNSIANARLLDNVVNRRDAFRRDPTSVIPWLLPPCRVRMLLVADGGLDFSEYDFGLSTFVSVLRDENLPYVAFDITLAHLRSDVGDDQMMTGAPGITRSITDFRFDDPAHFVAKEFDQIWLFGIDSFYHYESYATRNAQPNVYPADRLSDAELAILSGFMNGGGGLFATGDHGFLGSGLSAAVTRARSMRLWAPTDPDPTLDEVSMGGPRRNDTNRPDPNGPPLFESQSDDIPQEIAPTLFSAPFVGPIKLTWPHPLLCGPNGTIRVMPDHAHEGECVVPGDLGQTYAVDGTREYPDGPSGGPVSPVLVSRSTVLAGTTSGFKDATDPHSFGGICAYDGHLAGIGRVVTDATWHHFVNINLIGAEGFPETDIRSRGFLGSPAGEAHLEEIKSYYRNIAIWIATPQSHRCFRRKLIWSLLFQHRVLEAVLSTPRVELERAEPWLLHEIGVHAREVLGGVAGRCLALRIMLDLLRPTRPDLVPHLDPWLPPPPEPVPPLPPFADPGPLLDIALAGALLALRAEFPMPSVGIRDAVDERADETIDRGASTAVRARLTALRAGLDRVTEIAAPDRD